MPFKLVMSTDELLPVAQAFEESEERRNEEWRVRGLMARQVFFLWAHAVKEAIQAMRTKHPNDEFLYSDVVQNFLRWTDGGTFREQRNQAAHELAHLTYLMRQLHPDLQAETLQTIANYGLQISRGLLQRYGTDHIENSVKQQFSERMQSAHQSSPFSTLPTFASIRSTNWRQ